MSWTMPTCSSRATGYGGARPRDSAQTSPHEELPRIGGNRLSLTCSRDEAPIAAAADPRNKRYRREARLTRAHA